MKFKKYENNPILTKNPANQWEELCVLNPAVVFNDEDKTFYMLYRAAGNDAQHYIYLGLAKSKDGIHFERQSDKPLIAPDVNGADGGGCEDPRVAKTEDGLYVMFYTQWNRDVARLAVATSRDLQNWTKHGPAFAKAYDGRFANNFTKSASIITKMQDGQQVIAKFGDKYMMYWGEQFVNVATSTDLVNWEPMLDEQGELLQVMKTRPGYFDSDLTECGPPAIMTEKGIILFYNGKNKAGEGADPNYTANSYCAGQALFDKNDPTKYITRLDKPFFQPEADFEKSGQYPAGTVFIEGLVNHQGKWFLYYGCADSFVAVAIKN